MQFEADPCTLYDVGHEDGVDFLVMEYIEGETLADRLAKGALPLEQVLIYGAQIAGALDKAHGAGVIHRDLKPGNIIITKSGAKLVDFGLAKFKRGGAAPDLSAVTQQKPLTQEGAILGTFQYMAPEQLEGREADARTDIFAFGAVLYEMLTGKKAFEGESQASLIHAIMGVDPAPVSTLKPASPPALDHVIRSCLAKDPDERSQSAGEVDRNLRWIREAGADAVTAAPVASTGSNRERWVWAAALVLTAVAVWALMRSPPPRVARLSILAPSTEPFEITGTHQDVTFTPDGARIVYTATLDRLLVVRPLDQLESTPLRGSETGRNPFVSPDGNWVGFFAASDDTMKKISIHGGPVVTICQVERTVRGASWGEDDTIVFARSGQSGLFRVSAAGGEPESLTTPEENDAHRWPQLLPGGRGVLFTIVTSNDISTAQVAVVDLKTAEYRPLTEGTSPRYIDTGHIVYGVEGTLRAVPFDLGSLEVTGPPFPVLEGVQTKSSGASNFGLSSDGSLVYVSAGRTGREFVLTWDHRDGGQEQLNAPPRWYLDPSISPDGTRVAFFVNDGEYDIWIWDFERETTTRLTFDPATDNFPIWSPDGQRIVFSSNRDGGAGNLYWKKADGTGEVERLTEGSNTHIPDSISPDGTRIVFSDRSAPGGGDLHVLSLEAERPSEPLVVAERTQTWGAISPDGRWLAYASNETGNPEIYVRPFPNVNDGRWMISSNGGVLPRWGPDGPELFYEERATNRLLGVKVEPDSTFRVTRPQPILPDVVRISFGGNIFSRTYDVAPDGRKFLRLRPVAQSDAAAPQLIVVLNWVEELKRIVPAN